MRWRFVDPNNRREAAARKTVIARIDSWWREFEGKSGQLEALFTRKAKWDLPEWMNAHLQAIDPRLMWEYGPGAKGANRRLVITPESAHHLRPLVSKILERAPRLPDWEFYDCRLPEDLEISLASVNARTGCDIGDYKVRARRGANQCVDLSYLSSPGSDKRAFEAAFVATESLLGEDRLNRWIGAIDVNSGAGGNWLKSLKRLGGSEARHYIPLERLRDTVEAVIGSIHEQLPERPHCDWVDEAKWTLWKLEPETKEDYCGQQDLFVAKSANPSLWTAAHSGGLFFSERFTPCGETFCYVKLDGSQGLDQEKFADKGEIEDALDAVLKPRKLGCHFGGGTGQRYSYIDLALRDVDAGIRAVRQRLQAGNVPRRSWIQFFDADLAAEWVGIYDDSPAPPLPEDM